VSPGGIFFHTDASGACTGGDIEPDQRINVRLLIPREGTPHSEATVSLSSEGRVVRTERVQCLVGAKPRRVAPSGRSPSGPGELSKRWGIAVQFIGRPSVDLSVSSVFGWRGAAGRPRATAEERPDGCRVPSVE
jgi:hypothetical protein